MSDKKRSYRKNLTSYGLIYLGGEELEISVKNLSITGLLAELCDSAVVKDIKDVFKLIKASATIDLYLPEMRLAGEVEVVRADMIGDHIYFAVEYRTLTYDVNNLLYQRKAYRKNMTAPGQIVFNGNIHHFFTKNVSVEGLMIHLEEYIDVEVGTVSKFDFKRLEIKGKIKVVWIEYNEDGSTLMGLQYVNLEKDDVKGIPEFSPNVMET